MRPAHEPSAAGAGPAADEASPALPLQADEVLYAFKCEWDSICSFWEEDGGANAVFTVPRAELADGPTAPPAHAEDGAPEILPELVVADWRIADDGAPAELESAFYDYGLHEGLPDEIAHPHDWASEWRTKFGGVPYWTANGAQGVPAGRLLLQIDNWVQLEDGGGAEVANFCSDGTAYIFVDRSEWRTKFGGVPYWTANGAQPALRQHNWNWKTAAARKWRTSARTARRTSSSTARGKRRSTR